MLENLLKTVEAVTGTDELVQMAAASQGALKFSGALVGKSADKIFLLNGDGIWEVPLSSVVSAVEVPHHEAEYPFKTGNSSSVLLQIKRKTIISLRRQFEVGVDLVAKSGSLQGCPSSDCNQCSNGGCCCPPKATCLNVGCTD